MDQASKLRFPWAFPNARGGCDGFTLVELLVVIGIIAILASLLLPGLNHSWVLGNAQLDGTVENLRAGKLWPSVGAAPIYRCASDQELNWLFDRTHLGQYRLRLLGRPLP